VDAPEEMGAAPAPPTALIAASLEALTPLGLVEKLEYASLSLVLLQAVATTATHTNTPCNLRPFVIGSLDVCG
jgi:hypothetical protein